MTHSKKRKIYLVLFVFFVSLVSANISAASMNHMDDSKCMTQTTCNNCFIPATINSSGLKLFFSKTSQIFREPISLQSCLDAPPFPPPKG